MYPSDWTTSRKGELKTARRSAEGAGIEARRPPGDGGQATDAAAADAEQG